MNLLIYNFKFPFCIRISTNLTFHYITNIMLLSYFYITYFEFWNCFPVAKVTFNYYKNPGTIYGSCFVLHLIYCMASVKINCIIFFISNPIICFCEIKPKILFTLKLSRFNNGRKECFSSLSNKSKFAKLKFKRLVTWPRIVKWDLKKRSKVLHLYWNREHWHVLNRRTPAAYINIIHITHKPRHFMKYCCTCWLNVLLWIIYLDYSNM